MTSLITRRMALAFAGSALAAPALLPRRALAQAAAGAASDIDAQLAALESKNGGRLGVSVLNLGTGERAGLRVDERFPMCSTFKLTAAGLVLARVDRKEETLERRIKFEKADLVPWSPITEKHVGGEGMTVAQLCEAAMTMSDNTAANLLLASFGGPAGLTAWLRSLGDEVTRLDRNEPDLNESKPGDPRDTTSPAAMVDTMRKLLFTDALSQASRDQLAVWMVANKTGDKRIRAKLSKDWRIGDKTGTSTNGVFNDIAVVWPTGREPFLVAGYYAESKLPNDQSDAVLAEVGRLAAEV